MKRLRSLLLPLLLLLWGAPLPGQSGERDTLIQLVNNPVSDVLATYEALTGKQVIKEGSLPETTIHINVTEPVTREEAVELLESSLLLNGFAMVPGPGNSVKVVSLGGGKNPRSQGVKVFTDEAALPPGEKLVSYIMKLNFLSAQETAPIFNQHFAPTPPFGSIVAVPGSNILLITESAAVVRQIIRMQKLIDVPPTKVSAHFVPMLRANADRVVETITKVLGNAGGSTGSGAGSGDGAGKASRLLFNFGQGNPVEFAADTRTNRVIVVCNPTAFPYFETFVRSFDVPSGQAPSEEFKLRYVSVGDLLPAVATMLKEGRKDGDEADGQLETTQTSTRRDDSTTLASSTTTSTTMSGGSATNVLGTVQENDDKVLPLTVMVGNARLIADQRNNTIIAIAPPESLDRIASVIAQLDKPPIQVYLSIIIMELDVSDGLDFGIDFYRQGSNSIASNQRVGNVPSIQTLLNPETAANFIASSQNTPGLAFFGTFGQGVDLLVTALESTGRTKVLGRPTVYTSNNKKAVISVGEQIPVPQSTVSTVNPNQNNSTALTSTIDYKDVLLQLEVVPLINNDNEVTLEIAQKNDTLGQTYLIAGTEAQSVRTQQIRTSVTVPNKHTVVIGGLINDREEKIERKVPILGDIPLLGIPFRGISTKKQRKELILLIQPQIVSDNAALFPTDALEKRRTKVMRGSEDFINPPLPEGSEIPPEAQLVPFEPVRRATRP
ncbi:MAG TPA: secretin N-terminal domain-containing protein [Chthoniobacteraceae bacterium]|nr:secretin N-terminal domain-containing protein [Chthoniobacteraceae bacterium]